MNKKNIIEYLTENPQKEPAILIIVEKGYNNKKERDFLDNDEFALFLRETDKDFEYIRFNKKIKEIFKGE